METTIRSNQAKTSVRIESSNAILYSQFWSNLEDNRFGIIAMLVVIIGCSGGLSAAFGAQADALKLALVAFPSVIALALVIAVAPMKVITYVSAIALILDLIVLFF
ncbi:MAG: hypothetical protein H0U95_19220 [Bacteroidetes bacterium]|nr:hypothetical protein [Bacteroidota bacterium]